jgi:two-component SAPR family response regulator
MSAYMCPSLARKDDLDDDAFIQKPFTPERLTYAVKAILGESV